MVMDEIKKMSEKELLEEKRALERAIAMLELSMTRAGNWLISQFAPGGPIMREHSLSFCHKTVWGLFEDGRLDEVNRILDWIDANARVDPGTYFFPEEPPFEREMQLLYRFLTFGKVAEVLRHPAFTDEETRKEVLTYQHPCGGALGFKGKEEYLRTLNPLFTSFFGIWALKAGLLEPAKRAADFLVYLIELNRKYIEDEPGRFYFTYDPTKDSLNTDVPEGQSINYFFDTTTERGHFYHIGSAMALFVESYRVTGERRYIEVAEELAEFEKRLNPRALRWPSYCKIGWGAGELYSVTGKPEHRISAMNVCEITFISAQRACGGWSHMFYPLQDEGIWRTVEYDGTEYVPRALEDDGSWAMLAPQDISGEFLGEMGRVKKCFKAVLGEIERRLLRPDLLP